MRLDRRAVALLDAVRDGEVALRERELVLEACDLALQVAHLLDCFGDGDDGGVLDVDCVIAPGSLPFACCRRIVTSLFSCSSSSAWPPPANARRTVLRHRDRALDLEAGLVLRGRNARRDGRRARELVARDAELAAEVGGARLGGLDLAVGERQLLARLLELLARGLEVARQDCSRARALGFGGGGWGVEASE